MGTVIRLSRKDARETARLLRELQVHLESAIETAIAPGETEAFAAIDKPHVYADRVTFKIAERLIRKIDIALGDRRRPRRLAGTDNSTSPDSQTGPESPK